MNVVELLQEARDRIADIDHWCQHSMAQDSDGVKVAPGELTAVKFCAIGSLARTLILPDYPHFSRDDFKLYQLLASAANKLGYMTTVSANDHYGHEAVMKSYDLAIEMAKQQLEKGDDHSGVSEESSSANSRS